MLVNFFLYIWLLVYSHYTVKKYSYLDNEVFIGSDDGYGLLNPEAAEYTDGVCLKGKIQGWK